MMFRKLSSYGSNHFDLIISGGGMIGMTLACALGGNSLFKDKKVLLIENSPKSSWSMRKEFSNRVSSVNKTSKRFLNNLGIWNLVEQFKPHSFNDVKVWGNYSNLNTNFFDCPDEEMGYILENQLIVHSATKMVDSMSNVTVMYNTKVKEIILPDFNDEEKLPEIILHDGSKLICDLLIGADGANSLVRKAMNVNYLSWNYNQFAIVATLCIKTEGSNSTAWQKFLPNGPIALLPLSENFSSLVWSTSSEEAHTLLSLSDDCFVDAINNALTETDKPDIITSFLQSSVEGGLKLLNFQHKKINIFPPFISTIEPKSRAKFPLSFGHSSQYCAHRVCIVGDAAHKVHPLAGQGVNLGFHDIDCLRHALINGIRNGRELGSLSDLKNYERESLKHNVPLVFGIDFFHRLFVTNSPILKAAGNSAFLLAESSNTLRKCMMNFAS